MLTIQVLHVPETVFVGLCCRVQGQARRQTYTVPVIYSGLPEGIVNSDISPKPILAPWAVPKQVLSVVINSCVAVPVL